MMPSPTPPGVYPGAQQPSPSLMRPPMPSAGQPYNQAPRTTASAGRSNHPGAAGARPLKFGFEPCSMIACGCIVPVVAGGGILWMMKKAISKPFGWIKDAFNWIRGFFQKGAKAEADMDDILDQGGKIA